MNACGLAAELREDSEMPKSPSFPFLRYGVALLSVALAVGVRFLLDPYLGEHYPFSTFLVAVIVTAWYGGYRPSILALFLGLIAAAYFFIHPRYSVLISELEHQVGLVIYVFAGGCSILLCESLRAARSKAETTSLALQESNEHLELRVRQRTGELSQANTELQSEILERKQTEESLRRSQQQVRKLQELEAVGKLAGGMAHEFNNLLTTISGYSEIILNSQKPDDPFFPPVREIRKASNRAAVLVDQLLAFSRKQIISPKNIDLNAVVTSVAKVLQHSLGRDVQLIIRLESVGRVRVDPARMEQAIINLVDNARDAMPRGGTLTIQTRNIDTREAISSKHSDASPGPFVLLAVVDTGHGMDEKTKASIFDPFFTTKEVGKGIGMGLPYVYGTVKQANGLIEVESEPEKGAAFKIFLPMIDNASTQNDMEKTPNPGQGTETVLLVEDEELVRGFCRTILETNGYEVLEARNGESALVLCQQHEGPIHLLLTDLLMPLMKGRELAERLISLRPEMKVLFMSGTIADEAMRQKLSEDRVPYLQRPFSPTSLARSVREVLNRKV
jgi:signal transduction histidine kinase